MHTMANWPRDALAIRAKGGRGTTITVRNSYVLRPSLLDKYKVLFRDGSEPFVTAREFGSANDNNKHITDEERSIANQQHWTDRRAAKKIASYGRYCARNIIPQEVVIKPPLSSVPTSGGISTKTKSGRKGEEGPTAPAGDVGSLFTSTNVAFGSKSRPLTNAFLARYTNNAHFHDDEDFFQVSRS